jgi:hypothetical protein
MTARTHFLNVDLDLVSDRDLRPLARALEASGAYRLRLGRDAAGRHVASFELDTPGRSLDSTLRKFVRVIRLLPPEARAVWDGATERVFNAGFEVGPRPRAWETRVAPKTLQLLAGIGAGLALTLYPAST